MESDGGGVATAVTPRRLTSQHSTLRDSFIASDLADALNNEFIPNQAILGNTASPRRVSNLTLGAVLNNDRKSPQPANVVVRTLLDIIRNDGSLSPGSGSASSANNKKSWKSFKERLKLKRNQNLSHSQSQNQNPNSWHCGSSLPIPRSDIIPSSRLTLIEEMNRSNFRSSSLRQVENVPADDLALREVGSGGSPRSGGSFRLSAALAAERNETRRRLSRELDEENSQSIRYDNDDGSEGSPRRDGDEDEDGEDDGIIPELGAPSGQPMRMSLMDLLEETDRQAGIIGPTYRLDDDEKEEEAVEVEEDNGKGEFSCCVCMVRHKGAAFIPCGHTFCRLCSRELFVQRGNCPLCNNFILEILDIF